MQGGIAVYHGFQTDPLPYYAAADCVVLPSYHEGMSNVLLEAAAVGRPVITSDIPGCREAVEDGKTGLLCRARDTGSLYEKMRRMACASFAERQSMGQAAHEKMVRSLTRDGSFPLPYLRLLSCSDKARRQRRSCFDVEFMKLWVKRCYKRAFFGFIVCRLPMRFCFAIAMSGGISHFAQLVEQRRFWRPAVVVLCWHGWR